MKKRNFPIRLLALVLALLILPVPVAAEAQPAPIRTVEDLQLMAKNPTGSFILMNDLDMTGVEWKSLDFSGTFDGNGHAILNLTLSKPGNKRPLSCDGNLKGYETAYVGFFGTLKGATVKNLRLMGVQAVVESDEPCFLAGLAGYIDNSTVSNCTVTGTLELRAHDRMFGIGGIAGYGEGNFENCTVDVTLICTDTGKKSRDEQFMGGVLATGFANITGCDVTIDGYCSEYGYCHNGGMLGMLLRYPLGSGSCTISDNSVKGKITFFESNTDRRAYCEAVVGEYLCSDRVVENNKEDFLRDERMEYDVELRPEMCPNPVYTHEVIPGGCDTYGYTAHTCEGCGYTYKDTYTSFQHIPGEWTLQKEPTTEEEGISVGHCPCGQEFTRTEEKLQAPPETEAPTEIPVTESTQTEPCTESETSEEGLPEGLVLWLCVEAALVLALVVLLVVKRRIKRSR